MKKNKKVVPIKRDQNILKSILGEIDLRTKSETKKKPKYSRKTKHRKRNDEIYLCEIL